MRVNDFILFVGSISVLAACQSVDVDDKAPDALDQTVQWTTDRAGAIEFHSPVYEVPPYADQTMCYFDTYTGGEVGVTWGGFFQNMEYGHHVVLMASTADEDDWPDGTIADCTETDADIMTEARPFLFAGDLTGGLQPEMILPAGMAVKLKAGQRFVIQSHHINPTDTAVLVNDAVFLEPVETPQVDTWAAPWVHTQTNLAIPQGTSAETVDCSFDRDVNVLSLLGHLHEWGSAYKVEHFRGTDALDTLYDIPEWDVQFRDAPPINVYEVGSFEVQAGDRFVTTCEWDNDTGETLGFPVEMCATVGFAYPLEAPIICEP